MARWHASIPTALLTAGVMLACGSGPLDVRSSYRKVAPLPDHDPTLRVDRYTVPPDRALHAVTLQATAEDAQGATDQLRDDLRRLEGALAEASRCTLTVETYDASAPWGDAWRAGLAATLAVDLVGATGVAERMDRIDACRAAALPMLPLEQAEVGTDRHHVATLSGSRLVVDAPHEHLGALLDRQAKRLAAVAVASAPQLHPEDRRCVPTGEVRVGARTLAGVVLELGLDCRVHDAASPPPAEG